MKLRSRLALTAGKAAHAGLRTLGKNGGTLPGLIAEKLSPKILAHTLGILPDGVVIVTGTNGKTTTTKIITEILQANGKKVLTNKMGSNFTRGIVSVVAKESHLKKGLQHDVAVIELDEAYAKKFVEILPPTYVVALNVMRDQLDRFGEIDTTAELVGAAMRAATKGCIVNAEDPRLCAIAANLSVPVTYFGVSKKLLEHFPSDDDLFSDGVTTKRHTKESVAVELQDFTGQNVTYKFSNKKTAAAELTLPGQYNFQNGAAALALSELLLPEVSKNTLVSQLAAVAPAFGRGEIIHFEGTDIEIILIKNPSGFRLALSSFDEPADTLIAINDNDADGRDVSWLWDISFDSLITSAVHTSGTRAYDMALRLTYDNVPVGSVMPDLAASLTHFTSLPTGNMKRIYCNYTAMLAIRSHFGKALRSVS